MFFSIFNYYVVFKRSIGNLSIFTCFVIPYMVVLSINGAVRSYHSLSFMKANTIGKFSSRIFWLVYDVVYFYWDEQARVWTIFLIARMQYVFIKSHTIPFFSFHPCPEI